MLQPVEDAIRRRSDRAKHAQGCAQSQRPKCQSNAAEDVECDLDSIGKLLDENCDSQKGHSKDGHEDRNEKNLKLKQILRQPRESKPAHGRRWPTKETSAR